VDGRSDRQRGLTAEGSEDKDRSPRPRASAVQFGFTEAIRLLQRFQILDQILFFLVAEFESERAIIMIDDTP
jgi:hypothetical protein